ncbi:hypothetical protein EAI_02078 [Harpegnathos saltator]|uniref:Ig-like domain-containing protein n=1 Tax=Harpegnathos saltator TaxID=610380 RepID=E2BCR4_HARSA|nr:hypothetical protein EAI_02078 [Harpegnathos saltator]
MNRRKELHLREVTLSELRDSIARLRERVKLVCRTRGSPPPSVRWLKNGVPLHPRRGLRIQHKRLTGYLHPAFLSNRSLPFDLVKQVQKMLILYHLEELPHKNRIRLVLKV